MAQILAAMEKQTTSNGQEEINLTEDQIISALRALCSEKYGELTVRVMDGKPTMMYIRYDVKFEEVER